MGNFASNPNLSNNNVQTPTAKSLILQNIHFVILPFHSNYSLILEQASLLISRIWQCRSTKQLHHKPIFNS